MTAEEKITAAYGPKAAPILRALQAWVDRVIELAGTHNHESAEPSLRVRTHKGEFKEAALDRDERWA